MYKFEDIKPMSRQQRAIPPDVPTDKEPTPVITKTQSRRIITKPLMTTNHFKSRFVFWLMLILTLATLVFGGAYFFRSAHIVLIPKQVTGTIDTTIQIPHNIVSGLSYELMILSDSETTNVTATETTIADQKATGTIIIYNTGNVDQKLIAGTQVVTTDAKTFKLDTTVIIPKQNQKTKIPGQKESSITAFEAGDAYNIQLSDFTIPALKNKNVYARSKTPTSGGSQGTAYIVTKDVYTQTQAQTFETLKKRLIDEAQKQVPLGYILYPNLISFIPDSNQSIQNFAQAKTATVPITVSGKIITILIKRQPFEDTLVHTLVRDIQDTDKVTIQGIDQLTATLLEPTTITGALTPLSVQFTGDLTAVWNINRELIQTQFVNIKTGNFNTIVQTMPNIKEASLVMKPFWAFKTPTKVDRIHIIIQ